MRALIVDDEPTVCLLLSRILARDFDCVATEASNGIEALDLLSRHRYDFVLLDLLMPVMSGFETLEAMRRDEDLRSLPVMVLSTVREEARVRRAIDLGVSNYMTKPLRPADVSERLTRFVSRVTARRTRDMPPRSLSGLPDGARLLVVDGDRDFRHFVRSTLGHRYVVSLASGGAQGLRMALEQRPAAILLGGNLGALGAATFVEKLRSLPILANVPVISAASGRGGHPVDGTDGVIDRTFIPENFARQFAGLTAGEPPETRVLRERPSLRPQLISAAEQVFGMMLGLEVWAGGDHASSEPGDEVAWVPIALPALGVDLRVAIATPDDAGALIAQRLLQADSVAGDEVAPALQELVNMVGGRILDALRAAGDVAELGLPVTSRVTGHETSEGASISVGLTSAHPAVSFSVGIRALRRAEQPVATL